MFIEELEIKHVLGCQHEKLRFQRQRSFVYVVQGGTNSELRSAVSTAVKLICSGQFAKIESLKTLGHLHKGFVRLVLLIPKQEGDAKNDLIGGQGQDSASDSDTPCTSQQAYMREQRRKRRLEKEKTAREENFFRVDACRDFRNSPDEIQYCVDEGAVQRCTVSEFHCEFHTNIDHMLKEPLFSTRDHFSGKWLDLVKTDLNEALYKNSDIMKLFVKFAHLFVKNRYGEDKSLCKITTCCLLGQKALDVVLAKDVLLIFKDVRIAFEYITCNEYTVWFLIPYKGGHIDVMDVSMETLDFNSITTCIRLKSSNRKTIREYDWKRVDHAVQDMLFIAFQLVTSYHLKRGIIYLQDELNKVKDYQTMQIIKLAILHEDPNVNLDWSHNNYLQRIIEVCIKLDLTAILDYPGGLPLIPAKANIIKCYKDKNNGEWTLKVAENSSCSASKLIKTVESGLRN